MENLHVDFDKRGKIKINHKSVLLTTVWENWLIVLAMSWHNFNYIKLERARQRKLN